ncbi:hypothetical protein [Xanthocytophaga agilis]|uniref:Uncharacterized protein n=1 Tax=Xanthocytophaga agilis TaxID=3048010 RepID=A0AAE3R4D2_9BACT|nr:hypothetical protein [Xanthocytophaga agilis]MDJ1503406.1 hypothetical protein [Xanthocytophaga agilis]
MQPIKIIIRGNYFDCQIYRGRLYLWTFNGDLKVYDWEQLIYSFIEKGIDSTILKYGFLFGSRLYHSLVRDLLKDQDLTTVLYNKFNNVVGLLLELSEDEIEAFLIGEQDVPNKTLPSDTEIYNNKLYYITQKGFFANEVHNSKTKNPVSTKQNKLWDASLFSIRANKYPQIALSGGSEGLFEYNMLNGALPAYESKKIEKIPIFQVSKNHSSFANYSYLSIYNTSLVESSYMSTFGWVNLQNKEGDIIQDERGKPIYKREFIQNISELEIFNSKGRDFNKKYISWGIGDKIYKATEDGFKVVKFNNYANIEKGESEFKTLKSVKLAPWKGDVVYGGTTYFGNIIECENALVVIQSDNESFTIPNEITRWRTYPRSINYGNHLHVILDDRLEIYSFNHDYFVSQNTKNIGIEFEPKDSQIENITTD